ncbi:MAG: D-alanyl-D-alanine carboxypeptidase [Chitinophagaceae bacterium]
MKRNIFLLLLASITFSNYSFSQSIQEYANNLLLNNRALRNAYIGICIYNPQQKEYLYNHNAFGYFSPASDTKLYTFFTGLTLLGDSTSGIQYQVHHDTIYIRGTGDPSLLHPDFKEQTVIRFLKNTHLHIAFTNPVYENNIFGPGWSWDDYNEEYQPERSAMPLYGNVARFSVRDRRIQVMPEWFAEHHLLRRNWRMHVYSFYVRRAPQRNIFNYNVRIYHDSDPQEVPFIVNNGKVSARLLADALHKPVYYEPDKKLPDGQWATVHNIPLDSLFRNMLYRSDNFYAEQTLQMCSMKLFDTISTHRMIRYILEHPLSDLPNAPRWVDGSGLSRYNLFTPLDMVSVLNKIYEGFPHDRIYAMLPTGGEGTLKDLYHNMRGYIFAKTGSLMHVATLSGYLITKKGHTLIFSVLVNNCISPLDDARVAVEDFLTKIWETQ